MCKKRMGWGLVPVLLFMVLLPLSGCGVIDKITGKKKPSPAEKQAMKIAKSKDNQVKQALQDGCLFRSVTLRQYRLSDGSWSTPEYIPSPGYKTGEYRFVVCGSWFKGDRLSASIQDSEITPEQIATNGCGKSYPHLDRSGPTYVRTAAGADWKYGRLTGEPFTEYREIEIGCFAKSTLNGKCGCK